MKKSILRATALTSCLAAGLAAGTAAAAGIAIDGKTTIGGKMFFDITNINQKSDGVSTSANGTNFDAKRFYLIVNHTFDNVWSANLTTDFNYLSATKQTQLFVKTAFLQGKFNPALIVQVGSANMPWIPFVEDIYGYRYVENTLIDRTKFGTSADWGLHVLGSFANGMVHYSLAAVNGAGYKSPTRSKSIDLEGRISVNPVKDLTLAVGGYTGKLGKDIQGTLPLHTSQRFDALVAYTNSQFRIGGEYFYTKNWGSAPVTTPSDSADGFDVFGSYNVTSQFAVFGRYDWVKPSKDINPSLKDNYYNVGVSYSPRKDISLALVYKRDKVQNGEFSTTNGTIGGANNGTYDEVGLWGQFAF